jgi:hypothetical protein
MTKEEAEIVGKTWREVKDIVEQSALGLLCGGALLQTGLTGNWLRFTSPSSNN